MFEILLGIVLIILIIVIVKMIKFMKNNAEIILPIMYIAGTSTIEFFLRDSLIYIPIGITLWILGVIAVKGFNVDSERLIKFNLIIVLTAIADIIFGTGYIPSLFVLAFICIKILNGVRSVNRKVDWAFKNKGFIDRASLNGYISKDVEKCWIYRKNGTDIHTYAWKRYSNLADNAIYHIIANAKEKESRIVLFSELPDVSAYTMNYGNYVQEDVLIGNLGFIAQNAFNNMQNIANQAVTEFVPNINTAMDTEQIVRACGDPISGFVPSGWDRNNDYKCTLFDTYLQAFEENGTITKISPVGTNEKAENYSIYVPKSAPGKPPTPMLPPNQEGSLIPLPDDDDDEE